MGSRWDCFCELPVDSLLWREQSCPSSLSPALLFSQHLSGTRKTEPARTKVVCSPLAWAFKPAKITQNHSENRRGLTSQGRLRGEEMDPTLLSRVPEDSGTWLVYTLGVHWPQAWFPCPDWGDVWPQVGVWRLCEPHSICLGQDHVYGETT